MSQAGLTQRAVVDDLEPHNHPPQKECRGAGEGVLGHWEAEAGRPGMPYFVHPPPIVFPLFCFLKGNLQTCQFKAALFAN